MVSGVMSRTCSIHVERRHWKRRTKRAPAFYLGVVRVVLQVAVTFAYQFSPKGRITISDAHADFG